MKWQAMISAMASGAPQPMSPDSSFKLHMSRRIITRADSISFSVRFEITMPMAVTARHFIFWSW